MPYCTMPTAALTAANDTITVTIVAARGPVANRYTSGTSRNRTICLSAIRLVRGLGENAVETSVTAAYRASGQANRGTSIVSRSRMTSAIQQQNATAKRICATAIEN